MININPSTFINFKNGSSKINPILHIFYAFVRQFLRTIINLSTIIRITEKPLVQILN